jgi:sulfatase maturation enzyme AslB (radical SAM superfamily)
MKGEASWPGQCFAPFSLHRREKMEIANLTFIVTDDCNYNCTYCRQKNGEKNHYP